MIKAMQDKIKAREARLVLCYASWVMSQDGRD